jgi:transcriptional regulator with XRE-family HTH domain
MDESLHPVRIYRNAQTPPVRLEDLAAKIGITKPSLSRIETGKQPLSVDLAKKISDATDIPMRELCPEIAKMFAPTREAAE